MKQLTSPEFRKSYPRLQEPVEVTALGRVIGTYVPVGSSIDDRYVAAIRPGEPAIGPMTADRSAQQERDAILRRISKGS